MSLQEIWRAVPGYEGTYEASDHGRVRSLPRQLIVRCNRNGWNEVCTKHLKGTLLKSCRDKDGYRLVKLTQSGVGKTDKVHRVVMRAFNGPSNLEVNHKDGDKTNNSLSNLEYVTKSGNMKHAYRCGLSRPPTTHPQGEDAHRAKLSNADVQCIRFLIKQRQTQRTIAEKFCVCQVTISDIVRGKSWSHLK